MTPDFTTKVNVAEHKLKEFGSWINASLIPESIKDLEERVELTQVDKDLSGLTLEESKTDLSRKPVEIFQMNIALYCNQSCTHCHVESSPKRKEEMTKEVIDRCLDLIESGRDTIHTVDITGGAPELMTHFRYLVESVRSINKEIEIIDRCNLTVLSEPGQEDLAEFLANNQCTVVASLPCYSRKNVNLQRGKGVFEKSVFGLLKLNSLGYGIDPNLNLHLVYNPIGPFLPPPQAALQAKYKEELRQDFQIEFNGLFTITNMPIKRFADFLHRRKELVPYMELLVNNFNPGAVSGLMCRNTLSVRYDGALYDCDFNQQLDLGLWKKTRSIFDLDTVKDMDQIPINTDAHCYGCTAGAGSSCQGATE